MTDFFEKRDRWGNGLAVWVLMALAFLAPLAWWSLQQTHLENDVENWLPEDDPQVRILRWTREQFPLEERIFLSWDGSSLSDPRLDLLLPRLEGVADEQGIPRGGLKQVKSVAEPRDVLTLMRAQNIEPSEAIRRLQGVLLGAGRLKIRLTEAGRQRKRQAIEQLTAAIESEFDGDVEVHDPVDPLDLTLTLPAAESDSEDEAVVETIDPVVLAADGATVESTDVEHDFQIGFRGMRPGTRVTRDVANLALSLKSPRNGEPLIASCFFVPGSPIALSVTLSQSGIADKSGTLAAIRSVAAEVGISEETLRMGGAAVAGPELNRAVERAAWDPGYPLHQLHKRSVLLVSWLVGIVLAYVMVRSFRLATLVLAVGVYTTYLAVAVVPVTGGTMNMVLVVMPTLLLVLTLSAAIHVVNYWKHAAHRDPANAIVIARRMARQPCTLASVTTAIGLASLMTSNLAPVNDFGKYAALGTLLALGMVLYALPALLQVWPGRAPSADDVDNANWKRFGGLLTRHSIAVTAVCLAAACAATWGLRHFRTETKVIRYFPESSQLVQDYWFLENNLAGIIPVETIVRFDESAQRSRNLLERMELVRAVADGVRSHDEISGALSLADFRPVAETPPDDAPFLVKGRFNKRANTIEDRLRSDQAASVQAFYTVADEPHDLVEDGDGALNQAGDELWRITAQVNVMSDQDYGELTEDLNAKAQSVLRYQAGASHLVTGTVPFFLRTQQAVLESLIRSFALAFGLIAVIMMILLRNPLAGLVAMLPNLLPVGTIFGLISWAGQRVDIGTMITASVALGIAVDGTLHLLTWFREGVRKGMSRQEAVVAALGHCGPAMWQTSLAVGLGLLMLAPADLLLISRFGWLMAALIGTALVGDVVFLPALLASPLGRIIEKTALPETPPKDSPSAAPEPHLAVAPASTASLD